MTRIRPRPLLLLAAAALFAAAAAPAAAQAVAGRVLDARTGAPVPQATVSVLAENGRRLVRARTTAEGTFSLALPNHGTVRLRAERIGYQATTSAPLAVDARETVEVSFRLSTEPLSIDPLTVTARRTPPRIASLDSRGFYQRERSGFGRFLRREDFANKFNRGLADVLTREPSMRQETDARGRTYVYFARTFGPARPVGGDEAAARRGVRRAGRGRSEPMIHGCQPRLFLDGVAVVLDGSVGINELVAPESVEAIELFRGPSEVPPQYNGPGSACGVILVWTRAGDGPV